jgi:phosphoinositide-3-kinase regulatory subunit 4
MYSDLKVLDSGDETRGRRYAHANGQYCLLIIISTDERKALSGIPNVFSWQRMLETEKAAYLVRQFFYGSLYDRIRLEKETFCRFKQGNDDINGSNIRSTRPFLTLIEKKWIAYQLLHGVAETHSKQVCKQHVIQVLFNIGHIKTKDLTVKDIPWRYQD